MKILLSAKQQCIITSCTDANSNISHDIHSFLNMKYRFKDRRWNTYSRYQSPLTRLLYHKLCMICWYIKHTMYRHGYDSCGDYCRKQKHVSSVLLLLWLVRINGNEHILMFQLRNDTWMTWNEPTHLANKRNQSNIRLPLAE